MANIQSSINQAISLTALLATQNPEIKAHGEKKQLQKTLKKQEEAKAIEREVLSKQVEPSQERSELLTNVQEELAGIKKAQFKLNPTEESFERYYKTQKGANLLKKVTDPNYKTPSELRREQADISARMKQEQLMETRKRI